MPDTETTQFRTQFNGFHRADVAEYIAQCSRNHAQDIAVLEEAVADLHAENKALQDAYDALQEEAAALRQENEALQEELDRSLPADEPQAPPEETPSEKELAAYRRAAATEQKMQSSLDSALSAMRGMLRDLERDYRSIDGTTRNMVQSMQEQMQTFSQNQTLLTTALQQHIAAIQALKQEYGEEH